MRELIIPIGVVAVVMSMLVPLPPTVLDFLLSANLVLAMVLLMSTLYVAEPLKLSSLPTILLLATLYRLALNISASRAILSSGSAGEVIKTFGQVMAQGNLLVGVVVFLAITLVQFIVIAKGSERVAEVAARFTLDALPGRQMSIDADVRAGLLDFNAARDKRQELQIESRFYGALDGAMKFIKGDAIAGLVIAGINIVGGLVSGVMVQELPLAAALSKYTILTIGEGLLSQIPALLNSLAAGLVVTRVARGDGTSIAEEVLSQLGQMRLAKVIVGILTLFLAAVSPLPMLPLAVLGSVLLGSAALAGRSAAREAARPAIRFCAKSIPLLSLELSSNLENAEASLFPQKIEEFRQRVFDATGLILTAPQVLVQPDLPVPMRIKLRGVDVATLTAEESAAINSQAAAFIRFTEIAIKLAPELLDDVITRRMLDNFESEHPDLANNVVPGMISLTQVTELLRNLLAEGVSLRPLGLILQAVSERASKAASERVLLEEVRLALRRQICAAHQRIPGELQVITVDPLLDAAIAAAEREGRCADPRHLAYITDFLRGSAFGEGVVVVSRAARKLVREALIAEGQSCPVLAIEEIYGLTRIEEVGRACCSDEEVREAALLKLAA